MEKRRLTKEEIKREIITISLMILIVVTSIVFYKFIEFQQTKTIEGLLRWYSPGTTYNVYNISDQTNEHSNAKQHYINIINSDQKQIPRRGKVIDYFFGGVININRQFDCLNNLNGLTTIIQYKDSEKILKKPIAFLYHFHRYIKSGDPETFTSNAETIYGLVGKQSDKIIEIRRPYSREFRKTNSDRIWLIKSLSRIIEMEGKAALSEEIYRRGRMMQRSASMMIWA